MHNTLPPVPVQDMTIKQEADAQERQALQVQCNALQRQLAEGREREAALQLTIQVPKMLMPLHAQA